MFIASCFLLAPRSGGAQCVYMPLLTERNALGGARSYKHVAPPEQEPRATKEDSCKASLKINTTNSKDAMARGRVHVADPG